MNLVLRSFAIDEDGEIIDVDESNYFLGVDEYPDYTPIALLYQNYPNPCTDHTTISFDLPGSTNVKLDIYDINGNNMASIIDQYLATGRYEIKVKTSLLKTGTYIYKLSTKNSESSLRMIVKN